MKPKADVNTLTRETSDLINLSLVAALRNYPILKYHAVSIWIEVEDHSWNNNVVAISAAIDIVLEVPEPPVKRLFID